MAFFYQPSSRDAIGDPVLAKAVEDGQAELDPKKREAIYKAAFDRATAERYSMPLVPNAAVVAYTTRTSSCLKDARAPRGTS